MMAIRILVAEMLETDIDWSIGHSKEYITIHIFFLLLIGRTFVRVRNKQSMTSLRYFFELVYRLHKFTMGSGGPMTKSSQFHFMKSTKIFDIILHYTRKTNRVLMRAREPLLVRP